MQSKIRVLDEHTINKIAAGEVIENPASVVKELVENSIDSSAKTICVEIRGGGSQLIRITDDGCGMSPDDAILCLERHATSKIRSLDEIYELSTMGFRGEAVPSIASISKFTLLTRPQDESISEGTMVIVEGGKILRCSPVATSPGTTIEVKSLFFNVPVRRKFQKSPAHDAAEILKVLTMLALGNPSIKFQLTHNQDILLSALHPVGKTPQEQLRERVASVLGSDYAKGCCAVEGKKGEYALSGLVGLPSQHRQNRTGQHLFINLRGIGSPLVSFAVRDGYGTTLPGNRHPLFVLHLTMPGNLVDVNVHPQKREVRLRQEQTLRDMIVTSVQLAIQNSGCAYVTDSTPFLPSSLEMFTPADYKLPVPHATTPYPSNSRSPAFAERAHPFSTDAFRIEPPLPFVPPMAPLPQRAAEVQPLFSMPAKPKGPTVLATIPHYILLASPPVQTDVFFTGLCLVDQRAAHARVIFEKMSRAQKGAVIDVQSLLIPYTFELTPAESAILTEHLSPLNAVGVHIKEFGRCTFTVDALPQIFGSLDIKTFIQELLDRMQGCSDADFFQKEQDKQAAMAASRAAVSKGRRLELNEAQGLINQLAECEQPWQCPQGKSTILLLTTDEIKKLFR